MVNFDVKNNVTNFLNAFDIRQPGISWIIELK